MAQPVTLSTFLSHSSSHAQTHTHTVTHKTHTHVHTNRPNVSLDHFLQEVQNNKSFTLSPKWAPDWRQRPCPRHSFQASSLPASGLSDRAAASPRLSPVCLYTVLRGMHALFFFLHHFSFFFSCWLAGIEKLWPSSSPHATPHAENLVKDGRC